MAWYRGVFAWFCPLYTVSYVLLRCDVEEIPALLATEIPDEETRTEILKHCNIPLGVAARFIRTNSIRYGAVVAFWLDPRKAGLPVLAHELFHAVADVLDSRGLILSDTTDEAYCYYMEWLMRESLRRLGDPPEVTP
jgi:hypothetical protein